MTGSEANTESRDSGSGPNQVGCCRLGLMKSLNSGKSEFRGPFRNDGFNATKSSTETSARGRCGACRTITPLFLPRRFNFQTARLNSAAFRQHVAISRRNPRPSLARNLYALFEKRARGMPGAQCTRSLVRAGGSEYAHEYSQRRHRIHPAFPTQWFYGLYVISPARCVRIIAHLASASGCQDHTTSPSATRSARLTLHCGHRIPPPTFMTIAKRPSCGGGTRGGNHRFRKNRS
jgi:hypothetical protein